MPALPSAASDASDLLAAQLQQRAMAETDKWIGQLRNLVNQVLADGGDLGDLRDRIIDLYGQMDPAELGSIIAQATTLADCSGKADVMDGM